MKKETKKLIAAGIVMALSCGAWGSVQATDYENVVIDSDKNDSVLNIVNVNKLASIKVSDKTVSITSQKSILIRLGKGNLFVVYLQLLRQIKAQSYFLEMKKQRKLILI